MNNVGLPLREALPMVADVLLTHGLKNRIRMIASGKLVTPSSAAWARGFMFALGCIQALKCNRNTCPTGITAHQPHLIDGLNPAEKSVRVANYHDNVVHDVEVLAHACGVADPRELSRRHMRIMQADRRSVSMARLWPYPAVAQGMAAE
jgi:glutamate synthase domain-containing protein 2